MKLKLELELELELHGTETETEQPPSVMALGGGRLPEWLAIRNHVLGPHNPKPDAASLASLLRSVRIQSCIGVTHTSTRDSASFICKILGNECLSTHILANQPANLPVWQAVRHAASQIASHPASQPSSHDHGRPRATKVDHGRPRSTMVDHGLPWATIVDLGRPWFGTP